MLTPVKTIAIISTIAVCEILRLTLSFFLLFHPSNSLYIMRLHGDHRSVMVVTRQCHDPANTPPPTLCLMLACTKGGRNRGILRYLQITKIAKKCTYKYLIVSIPGIPPHLHIIQFSPSKFCYFYHYYIHCTIANGIS